jgi:hypothetical protein
VADRSYRFTCLEPEFVMRELIIVGSLFVLASCGPKSPPAEAPADSAPAPSAGDIPAEEADYKVVEQLEAAARAIVKTDGCSTSADCRAAPIGVRGCGGPRDFIVYCSKNTDSVALYQKIAAADSAEAAYNARYKVGSTCELRMAPAVGLSGGACVANR